MENFSGKWVDGKSDTTTEENLLYIMAILGKPLPRYVESLLARFSIKLIFRVMVLFFIVLVHQHSSGQSGIQIPILWLMLALVMVDGVLTPTMQQQR